MPVLVMLSKPGCEPGEPSGPRLVGAVGQNGGNLVSDNYCSPHSPLMYVLPPFFFEVKCKFNLLPVVRRSFRGCRVKVVDADVLSLLEQVWVGSLGLNQGIQPSYRAQHPTFSGEI